LILTVPKGGPLSKGLWKFAAVISGICGVLGLLLWQQLPQPETQKPSASVPAVSSPALESVKIKSVFFFPKRDLTGLEVYLVEVPDVRESLDGWVAVLCNALSVAPAASVLPVLPPEVVPRSVFRDEQGALYIDFPESVRENPGAGVAFETLSLEAMLKTIGKNVPGISQLKILVGGRDVDTLWGHVDLRRFFPVVLR
jgi:hypothetical protein